MDIFQIVVIVFMIVYFICSIIKKYSKNRNIKLNAFTTMLTSVKCILFILIYMTICSLLTMFFPNPEYETIIKFVIAPIIILFIILKNNKKEVRKIKLKVLNKINERKYKD